MAQRTWAADNGIALDPRDDVAIGVQLDWSIRAAIAAGRLAAGDRLPGLRDLATELGVNHNTVRAAVAKLEADGLLETKHGTGTFVAQGAAAHARHAPLVEQVARWAADAGLSTRELAAALYVTRQPASERDTDAEERRALRDEIAVLERVLAQLEELLPERLPPETAERPRGGRLLGADELRGQRDRLVRRIATVQGRLDGEGDEPESGEPASERGRAATKPLPRPGISPA
jgi:DNA-binding transcriptional regulator YhcF (GntR family)